MCVFSIAFSQSRISVGSSVSTHTMLISTPLASTIPISDPILKLSSDSTASPTTVVSALEAITG